MASGMKPPLCWIPSKNLVFHTANKTEKNFFGLLRFVSLDFNRCLGKIGLLDSNLRLAPVFLIRRIFQERKSITKRNFVVHVT